jgi:ribosomal protein S25
VGHVAIKMLQYIEQCESELKQALQESFKKRSEKKQEGEEGKNQEDDLAQITGGKEAEVEQYTQTLQDIAENQMIQEGLLGKFTPILVSFAHETLRRYTEPESALRAPHLCLLERSAILALCKFMCVSSKICA